MLKKVIKENMIKNEYKDFVEQFAQKVLGILKDNLHSLYICGSIPKGTANMYRSDADFTIVCKRSLSKEANDEVLKIKSELLNFYPFVAKIDTTIISIDDVSNNPLDWGFWIKIICFCIYGPDLGEEVPEIDTNKELIINLLSDFDSSIHRLNFKLNNTSDEVEIAKTIRGYSKRLIRSLYTLILEEVGEWNDDLLEMKIALGLHMKENSFLVEKLYMCYSNPFSDWEAFRILADQAIGIINDWKCEHGLVIASPLSEGG